MLAALANPCRIKRNHRRRRTIASGRREYNYFRDYDSATDRYLQSDPMGLGGGISTYAYVGGKPLNHIDPTGLAMSPLRECGGKLAGCGDPPPPSCGCDWPRPPDFIVFELGGHLFGRVGALVSATYTINGDVFAGGGVGGPSTPGQEVEIADGWLLKCNPSPSDINGFLKGWSAGGELFLGIGGGFFANGGGKAIIVGVGWGGSFGPSGGAGGAENVYQGNIFGP